MARTNTVAVQGVLFTDYDAERRPSLTPYVATANTLVNRAVAYGLANGRPLSEADAELLERWLAAHFYACVDQPYASRSQAGSGGSFQGKTGMYLEATKYGHAAVLLDTTGYLQSITSQAQATQGPKVASLDWLGKTPSEQVPAWERG